MAQTKRKRRSKHRGTAAGTIQTRGRTGRPTSADERKKLSRTDAREQRLSRPPTWRSSLLRASFAAVIMFGFLAITSKSHSIVQAASFAVFALLLYVPAGYYLETFLYRRRMRKKPAGK
jgi:hypothetical protein